MDRSGNMVWAPSAHGKADFVTHHDDGSGTSSSATSHIAGMAANIWSENPSQNKWQVRQKMMKSADFGKRHPLFGFGRVHLMKHANN